MKLLTLKVLAVALVAAAAAAAYHFTPAYAMWLWGPLGGKQPYNGEQCP